jgi:hypothetical protein
MVRTMAESHGWTVHVDEAYADGTRFVFAKVLGAGGPDDGGEPDD